MKVIKPRPSGYTKEKKFLVDMIFEFLFLPLES
jgi:hypothetical protein